MTTGGLSAWSPCTHNQEAERRPEVGYKTSRCGPLPAEKLYLLHYKPSETATPAGEQVSAGRWGMVCIQIPTGTGTAQRKSNRYKQQQQAKYSRRAGVLIRDPAGDEHPVEGFASPAGLRPVPLSFHGMGRYL